MAYERTWNIAYEATPAGTDQRNIVDDRIRELKVDVRERMESLTNWTTTEPVSLKTSALINHTSKVLMIHAGSFSPLGFSISGISTNATFGIYASATGTPTFIAGLILPETSVITAISSLFYNDKTATCTVTQALSSVNWAVPITINADTFFNSQSPAAGAAVISSATGSEIIQADRQYYIKVIMTRDGVVTPAFYGTKVTYTVPTLAALR